MSNGDEQVVKSIPVIMITVLAIIAVVSSGGVVYMAVWQNAEHIPEALVAIASASLGAISRDFSKLVIGK